jgi:hypothetical protein
MSYYYPCISFHLNAVFNREMRSKKLRSQGNKPSYYLIIKNKFKKRRREFVEKLKTTLHVLARWRETATCNSDCLSLLTSIRQHHNDTCFRINTLTEQINAPIIPGESFSMANRPGLGKRPSSTDRGVSPPLTKKQKQQSTTTSECNDRQRQINTLKLSQAKP